MECQICHKHFKSQIRLTSHIDKKVCQPENKTCKKCGKTFKDKRNYDYHTSHNVCEKQDTADETKDMAEETKDTDENKDMVDEKKDMADENEHTTDDLFGKIAKDEKNEIFYGKKSYVNIQSMSVTVSIPIPFRISVDAYVNDVIDELKFKLNQLNIV